MKLDDLKCTFGDEVVVTNIDGNQFRGILVDIEYDFDGSYGGDSISISNEDYPSISFKDSRIVSIDKV